MLRPAKPKTKRPPRVAGRPFARRCWLEARLDLDAPCLEQRLRNVLRVLVAASPLAQAGGALKLVGCQLELLHYLLKFRRRWNNRADRLRLAPVRISTTLCHNYVVSFLLDIKPYKIGFASTSERFSFTHLPVSCC